MNGGYTMVDCAGVDLLAESSATVDGLYNKLAAALKAGKPIIAHNVGYDDAASSPIQINVIPDTKKVLAFTGVYVIEVTDADAVTVTDLTAGDGTKTAAKKTKKEA